MKIVINTGLSIIMFMLKVLMNETHHPRKTALPPRLEHLGESAVSPNLSLLLVLSFLQLSLAHNKSPRPQSKSHLNSTG